jgi:hypothetical protein
MNQAGEAANKEGVEADGAFIHHPFFITMTFPLEKEFITPAHLHI